MRRSDNAEHNSRHYSRRRQAAIEGRHLPTNEELLRGCPFLGERIGDDVQTFVERILPRFDDNNDPHGNVRSKLRVLTIAPDSQDFLDAVDALDVLAEGGNRKMAELAALASLRCTYYAASSWDRSAYERVAAEALDKVFMQPVSDDVFVDYATAALGWLALSKNNAPRYKAPVTFALDYGERIVRRLTEIAVQSSERLTSPDTEGNSANSDVVKKTPESKGGVVVVRLIGNAGTTEGRRVVKEFDKIIGRSLPLIETPNLAKVRSALVSEFPYASNAIDRILNDLAASRHVRFRPTIFVGKPGSGKTTFAGRLFDVLGIQHTVYSCGGVSNSSLAGTPRRWSTGEPSLPVSLVTRWQTAAPGIVLDETEKAGTSRHNGNLLDSLLGLLEPRSSSAWHDPYIQAEVDLSHVLWIGTANSLDGVPGPLRDRCRIIVFPEPQAEHLDALAPVLLQKVVAAKGLDVRWAVPFDGDELEALRRVWPGGSIRLLTKLIEGLLGARENDQRQH